MLEPSTKRVECMVFLTQRSSQATSCHGRGAPYLCPCLYRDLCGCGETNSNHTDHHLDIVLGLCVCLDAGYHGRHHPVVVGLSIYLRPFLTWRHRNLCRLCVVLRGEVSLSSASRLDELERENEFIWSR